MSEGVIRVKNLWHKILFLVLGEENEFRSTVSAIPNIALTCKSWNQSLEHEGFWKSLYLRDFKHGLNFEIPEGLSWRNVYKSHLMDTLVVHTTFSGDLNQRITKNFWEDVEKRGSWKLNAFMGLPPRLPIDTKKLDPLKSIILTFDFDIKGEYDLVKDQINESFNWLTELFFRPESKVTVAAFPNKEKTVITAVFTTIIEGKTNDPIEFLLQKQRKGAWDFQKRVWGNGLIVYPMYRAIRKLKKSIELLRKPHNPKYKRISKIFQKNNSGNNENSGEENISIIELLAFAKETCGLTKNYKSVEEFKDELGEEFLKEQIDMMKKAEEKKKMEMLDFQFAQQMASDNPVKIDYNDDYYSYGSNTKEREKKFDRRQKKDRKLYTRRTYTSQLDVRWMKFFSEFRTENLKLGFNVPIEQGNYEWTKREQFKNLFKNVGGLRRWMITNRRGSSLSINFDQSPLPLISFYFTMMNMEDPNAPQEEQRLEDGTTREQFQEFEDIARQKMDEERKNRGQHPSYDSMWEYGRGKLLDDIEKYSEGDDYSTNALNDESEKDTK